MKQHRETPKDKTRRAAKQGWLMTLRGRAGFRGPPAFLPRAATMACGMKFEQS
jgi:hypothetical protein